jgi:NDP-sugar pyrophosphorylase family protein
VHAIILTDKKNSNLGPLNDKSVPALLPVAGKPIVLHLLEQLHRSGIKSVSVVSRTAHDVIDKAIDTRPLLGMSVTFLPAIEQNGQVNHDILVIGTHQLVDTSWEYANGPDANNSGTGITRLTSSTDETLGLVFHARTNQRIPDTWGNFSNYENSICAGTINILKIESLTGYRTANFEVLDGNCKHLFAAGRQVLPNLRVAPKARVPANVAHGKHAYIGGQSRIKDTVKLYGNVVIGDDVYVDKHARITNSIILDDTYIGAMTSIENAIVKGNMLIKIDSGVCLTISDPVLLSEAV